MRYSTSIQPAGSRPGGGCTSVDKVLTSFFSEKQACHGSSLCHHCAASAGGSGGSRRGDGISSNDGGPACSLGRSFQSGQSAVPTALANVATQRTGGALKGGHRRAVVGGARPPHDQVSRRRERYLFSRRRVRVGLAARARARRRRLAWPDRAARPARRTVRCHPRGCYPRRRRRRRHCRGDRVRSGHFCSFHTVGRGRGRARGTLLRRAQWRYLHRLSVHSFHPDAPCAPADPIPPRCCRRKRQWSLLRADR